MTGQIIQAQGKKTTLVQQLCNYANDDDDDEVTIENDPESLERGKEWILSHLDPHLNLHSMSPSSLTSSSSSSSSLSSSSFSSNSAITFAAQIVQSLQYKEKKRP